MGIFYMVTSFLAMIWRPLRRSIHRSDFYRAIAAQFTLTLRSPKWKGRTLVLHQVYSTFIAHWWHGCDRL